MVAQPATPQGQRPADARVATVRTYPQPIVTRGSVRYVPAPGLATVTPTSAHHDHDHDHRSAPSTGNAQADDHDDIATFGAAAHDDAMNRNHVPHGAVDRRRPSQTHDTSVIASRDDARYAPRFNDDGIAWPYPSDKFFRGFGPCHGGSRHSHEAIDLGGVGPNWGVGTPIRSMGKAEIVFIGLGRDNPELFGEPDLRGGTTVRGKRDLPRKAVIAPYGEVAFFTRTKGRWRSGNIIVTRVVDGPLKGHIVRYLHVAAVHPELRTGSIVEAGQEIALMGGTGVQESPPHLHLDIEAPGGHRVDVAPIVGLAPTASCEGVPSGISDSAADLADATKTPTRYARLPSSTPRVEPPTSGRDARKGGDAQDFVADDDAGEVGRVWVQRLEHGCAEREWSENFASGRYEAHALVMKLGKGESLDLTLTRREGDWLPVLTHSGRYLKTKKVRAKKGEQRLVLKATRDTEVTLKVESRRDTPPRDAAYMLAFGSTCPASKSDDVREKSDEGKVAPAKSGGARTAKARKPKTERKKRGRR
jgi:hypothetical protein